LTNSIGRDGSALDGSTPGGEAGAGGVTTGAGGVVLAVGEPRPTGGARPAGSGTEVAGAVGVVVFVPGSGTSGVTGGATDEVSTGFPTVGEEETGGTRLTGGDSGGAVDAGGDSGTVPVGLIGAAVFTASPGSGGSLGADPASPVCVFVAMSGTSGSTGGTVTAAGPVEVVGTGSGGGVIFTGSDALTGVTEIGATGEATSTGGATAPGPDFVAAAGTGSPGSGGTNTIDSAGEPVDRLAVTAGGDVGEP
jgi:hypothetical protein